MTSRDDSEVNQLNSQLNITIIENNNCTSPDPVDQVSWEDRGVYSKLALGAVGVGLLFQGFLFHFTVHEPDNSAECQATKGQGCYTFLVNLYFDENTKNWGQIWTFLLGPSY